MGGYAVIPWCPGGPCGYRKPCCPSTICLQQATGQPLIPSLQTALCSRRQRVSVCIAVRRENLQDHVGIDVFPVLILTWREPVSVGSAAVVAAGPCSCRRDVGIGHSSHNGFCTQHLHPYLFHCVSLQVARDPCLYTDMLVICQIAFIFRSMFHFVHRYNTIPVSTWGQPAER